MEINKKINETSSIAIVTLIGDEDHGPDIPVLDVAGGKVTGGQGARGAQTGCNPLHENK